MVEALRRYLLRRLTTEDTTEYVYSTYQVKYEDETEDAQTVLVTATSVYSESDDLVEFWDQQTLVFAVPKAAIFSLRNVSLMDMNDDMKG